MHVMKNWHFFHQHLLQLWLIVTMNGQLRFYGSQLFLLFHRQPLITWRASGLNTFYHSPWIHQLHGIMASGSLIILEIQQVHQRIQPQIYITRFATLVLIGSYLCFFRKVCILVYVYKNCDLQYLSHAWFNIMIFGSFYLSSLQMHDVNDWIRSHLSHWC